MNYADFLTAAFLVIVAALFVLWLDEVLENLEDRDE